MNDTNQQESSSITDQTSSGIENNNKKANELIQNPIKDDKQIPLYDTKDRNSSSVIKYTVQEGESLHNISKKFSISKDLIKSSNGLLNHHVHPGDTLKIYLGIDHLAETDPIDVFRYNQNGKSTHVKGKLMIKDYELSFHPHSIGHHPIKTSIFGHLESSIVQNPSSIYFQSKSHHHHSSANFSSKDFSEKDSENLSVLSIEYLNDDDILMTDYFIGPKEDIEKFQNILSTISTMIKTAPETYNPEKLNNENRQLIAKQRQHHNSFSFHTIQKLNQQNESTKPVEAPPQIPQPEPVFTDIVVNGKSNILTEDNILQFRKQLPKYYRNSNWTCLFQTRIHGYSLSTLFSKTNKKSPLILFIKTTRNEVLGAFIYNELKIADKYYGNYETFVFHFQPNMEFFHWDIRKPKSNRYFILSNLDSISFGASSEKGEGSAIFIRKDLNTGFSEQCDTYSSPQLTSTKKFTIEDLEIWDIGINSEYMF